MTAARNSDPESQDTPAGPEPAARASTAPGPGIPTGIPGLLGRAAVMLACAFVAVTAFVLAYDGSRGAAVDAGIQAAAWYPFCIEGVIVCASVATLTLPGRRYPWVILLGFSAVSVAANVLHAGQHPGARWWSMLFAAVPPLTLPICVHLVLMVAHARGSAGPTVAVHLVEPPVEPGLSHAMGRVVSQPDPVVDPVARPVLIQGLSQPVGHADPVVDPAVDPAPGGRISDGSDEVDPQVDPRREPAAPAAQPYRISRPEPAPQARRKPAQRAAGKPKDSRAGARFHCPCCGEMVSRMTLDRHAEKAAELAVRIQSNGHRERVSVP